MTCNTVAIALYVLIKCKSYYISADVAKFGKRKNCNPKIAGSSPLCATIVLPSIFACFTYVFTSEDPKSYQND